MKYSDNLTDLVEHLEKDSGQQQEKPANEAWTVRNDAGETIKLDDHLPGRIPDKF